jgi:hypothetical protein
VTEAELPANVRSACGVAVAFELKIAARPDTHNERIVPVFLSIRMAAPRVWTGEQRQASRTLMESGGSAPSLRLCDPVLSGSIP